MRLLGMIGVAALVVAPACGGGGGGDDNGGGTGPQQTLGEIRPSVTTLNLNAGQSATITVTALNTSGGTISSAGNPSFTSRSTTVAEVTNTGVVFGLAAGTTTIDVSLSFGGVTKTATVAVTVTGTLPASASVAAGSAANTFQPQVVGVSRGGTVTWSFAAVEHNVTFSAGGAPANIPNTTNANVSRTFGTAGNFPYDCSLHAGMVGTVIVR
jgi:plastocyanin